MATEGSVKVLEQYVVAPLPETSQREMSLPLTLFDMIWVCFSPVERLVFYEIPLSRSHFVDVFIPKLKSSLSSAIKDFLPMAGNLIIPSDSRSPELRYSNGDGLSIVFAESCNMNFNYLTANHARNSREFYPLVPRLHPPSTSSDTSSKVVPVVALQVTLFPEIGICLGITNHHAVGDASTIFSFIKAWALHTEHGGNEVSLGIHESLPFYDRSVVKDPKGIGSLHWNQLRSLNLDSRAGNLHTQPTDTNKTRQTFILDPKDIQKLKNLVQTTRPTVKRLSSFTVTCAYVWTCLVKSRGACGEVPDEAPETFVCTADCRSRLDPQLPANYFGNCLTICYTTAKIAQLVGEEGFQVAVEKIGEKLHQRLQNKDEILKDAETWITTVLAVDWNRTYGVAGSPRYNYYDLDFGWGKPRKFECISIDQTGAISLSGCKDSGGGLEIGLSYSKQQIDAFATIFNEGLEAL